MNIILFIDDFLEKNKLTTDFKTKLNKLISFDTILFLVSDNTIPFPNVFLQKLGINACNAQQVKFNIEHTTALSNINTICKLHKLTSPRILTTTYALSLKPKYKVIDINTINEHELEGDFRSDRWATIKEGLTPKVKQNHTYLVDMAARPSGISLGSLASTTSTASGTYDADWRTFENPFDDAVVAVDTSYKVNVNNADLAEGQISDKDENRTQDRIEPYTKYLEQQEKAVEIEDTIKAEPYYTYADVLRMRKEREGVITYNTVYNTVFAKSRN